MTGPPRIHPASRSRGQWRLILDQGGGLAPSDGPTNMAIDQALLAAVCDGASPALRFYRWNPPTLSFGRNQPARGLYDVDGARARGLGLVRRPTGGQAVLHADELTYAVVAPVELVGKPREAYTRINAAIVAGLRSLGLAASVAEPALRGRGRARSRGGARTGTGTRTRTGTGTGGRDWGRACFGAPAVGEVVVGGRKLVGSAQRCERRTILQHGSILIGGSQAAAEDLLLGDRGPASSEAGWTTLGEELGRRPTPNELVEVLTTGFSDVIGTPFAPAALATNELKHVTEFRGQFAAPEWTWRR